MAHVYRLNYNDLRVLSINGGYMHGAVWNEGLLNELSTQVDRIAVFFCLNLGHNKRYFCLWSTAFTTFYWAVFSATHLLRMCKPHPLTSVL